jgi:hypothetical protein
MGAGVVIRRPLAVLLADSASNRGAIERIPIDGGAAETLREGTTLTLAGGLPGRDDAVPDADGQPSTFAGSGGLAVAEYVRARPMDGPWRDARTSRRRTAAGAAAEHRHLPDGEHLAILLIDGATTNIWKCRQPVEP